MPLQAASDLIGVLGVPFLACVAMTAILGYLGLHVLRREIVFVDIAMAQIVAVGAVAAHLLFAAGEDSLAAYLCAFVLAVVAAAFYAVTRRKVLEISAEAVIGVSYAIAAAVALFLLGVVPEGHVHAQHMLAGSILWATWDDVALSSAAFALVGLCFYLLRRPFERISNDYQAALEAGMRVAWWDFLFYTLIGVVITFAVRIGGVVVVFCLLIIPATIAVMVSRNLVTRLVVAWLSGMSGSLLGLLFAERLDFSMGPSVALLLGIGLVIVGTWQRAAAVPATIVTAAAAALYIALLVIAPSRPGIPGPTGSQTAGIALERPGDPATDSPAGVEPRNDIPSRDEVGDHAGFAVRFDQASDSHERSEVALEALENDPEVGVDLALRFLREDPPFYFRQTVVERLERQSDQPLGFDVTRPFTDPVNQRAADRLRKAFGAVE